MDGCQCWAMIIPRWHRVDKSMISRLQPEAQDTPTVSVYILSGIDLCRFLRFVWKGAGWHPLFKPAMLSR